MKVLVFLGSPRKSGNTETLVQSLMAGVEEAGGNCELIRLADLDIHPCIGCGNCEKEGDCIFKDDMQDLYLKIAEADRVVIASPIYFYGVTAQAKAFVDRCQTLWSRKYVLKQRLSGDVPKVGYYLGVSATKGERIFEGAILTAKYGLDAMDYSYGGEFVVRGVDKKGDMKSFQEELDNAMEFGASIVET